MKILLFIFVVILSKISCLPLKAKEKRSLQNKKSDDIVILHTNDVHCGVQDSIGYDGLMLYKKQLLQKYNNVILVDAGDHIQGGIIGTITNGEAIINIMNKLKYDVVTIGNHEFDYEITQLENVAKKLNCGYISANYCFRKNKTSIYPAYKILEIDDKKIKIGFIGVTTPQTLSKTYLITLLDNNGELIYDFLTDNHSQELYARVQQNIDFLKNEKDVDYIIILAHLGIDGDALEENTSAALLKNLKNVNALIDGHTHLVYSKTTLDKDGKNVILAQTGTKLENIGVLIIHEDGTLSHKNINEVPFDSSLADETLNITTRNKKLRYVDKEMNKFINDIFDSFSDTLNKVIGKTDFLLNIYKNATESTQSSTQLSRLNENALCNLVADSMRELGEADISIINAGTVRSDINQGNIRYQDVIDTLPFSNDILIKEIKGQTILEALEFGVRTLPERTPRFPQVSGITFKVDTSINSTVIVDENEVFKKLGNENRVYDVKINGEKLDMDKKYKICSHNFILGGGDGYSMFTDYEITKTSVGVDNEVLLKYIQKNLNGTIPIKYKTSEGRLIKTNGKIFDDISISLLGFNGLNITSKMIQFNTYFTSLEKKQFEFPKQVILEATLSRKSKLRGLQETKKNAYCFIQNEVNETNVKHLCEISGDTSNINNIKIKEPEYSNFAVKLSPLASNYMNNLEEIKNDEKLKNLDKNLIVLQNASLNIKGYSTLISGSVDNNKLPLFNNNKGKLMAKQLPYNNNTYLNCLYDTKEENNFTLKCEIEPNVEYDLDNSLLVDNDKLVIINFQKDAKSTITEDDIIGTTGIRYRSSKKLSKGIIAMIIIVPIVLVAITIGIMLFLIKSRKIERKVIPSESSTDVKNDK